MNDGAKNAATLSPYKRTLRMLVKSMSARLILSLPTMAILMLLASGCSRGDFTGTVPSPDQNKALDAACKRLASVVPKINANTDDQTVIDIDRFVQVFDGDLDPETGKIKTPGVCPGYLRKTLGEN